MQKYQLIKRLDDGKTAILFSPLGDNIVRSGTVHKGSSFFHSILTSYSSKYRKSGVFKWV